MYYIIMCMLSISYFTTLYDLVAQDFYSNGRHGVALAASFAFVSYCICQLKITQCFVLFDYVQFFSNRYERFLFFFRTMY